MLHDVGEKETCLQGDQVNKGQVNTSPYKEDLLVSRGGDSERFGEEGNFLPYHPPIYKETDIFGSGSGFL